MPPSDQLVARYRRLLARQRAVTAGLLVATWDRLDSWEEDDADRYEAAVTPALRGAKAAAVTLTAGFIAAGMRVRPVAVTPDDVDVQPRTRHPFLAMWHALAEDRPFDEALQAGRSQAEAVGFDLVQSTSRRTGDIVARRSGQSTRWRRVPGPTACSWCLTVSGQLYHSSASADFGHDRCDCVAVPAA